MTFTPPDTVSVIHDIYNCSPQCNESVEAKQPISKGLCGNIPQIDGIVDNDDFMFDFEDVGSPIPVHIQSRLVPEIREKRKKTLKTIRRIPPVNKCSGLPSVICLNPRSLYGKEDDVGLIIQEYSVDLAAVSESWNRVSQPITAAQLNLENYEVITGVNQRHCRGGKPLLIINTLKYHIKELQPNIVSVPNGVEATWALIKAKRKDPAFEVNYIAVCSFYFSRTITPSPEPLYDHIAETYNTLIAKYGKGKPLHFIICADSNRLDLSPICRLSPQLKQVVKVPTRLNPPATLDIIITSLAKYYSAPQTKPPVESNNDSGAPSDHLVVLWEPLTQQFESQKREYKLVKFRPHPDSGLAVFHKWISQQSWKNVYDAEDVDKKAEIFQSLLLNQYHMIFPMKEMKVSSDDKPWYSQKLKNLDRKRRREFCRHKKSEKWRILNEEYKETQKKEKANYYKHIVKDLKETKPSSWYSKVKRMAGNEMSGDDVM